MEESGVVKIEQQLTAANMISRLPLEVISRILSKLPIINSIQSKLVCPAWRNLIQDPVFASEHFSQMAENDPSFIIETQSPNKYQLLFTDFSQDSLGKLILKKPPTPIMTMSYLVDSCNGLLLCRSNARGMCICNPFTKLTIDLPKLVITSGLYGNLEFGFHPTTKEYKLVRTKRLRRRELAPNDQSALVPYSEVHVLTLGSPTWRNLGVIPHRFARQASKVIVDGRLNWLSRYSWLIISFDLETEQFHEVPKPDVCDLDQRIDHLVVLRGCLSVATYPNTEILEIWVMKEYGVKESWIKEFNIVSYLPSMFPQPTFGGPRNYFSGVSYPNSRVRVVCSMNSGEILLAYGIRSRALALYDPQNETFKELRFPDEMPNWYTMIVHVGSLNWIDTPINI